MKIAIDIGHNLPCDVGASYYLNEDKCTKETGTLVIKYLKELGHTVIPCLPSKASSQADSLYKRANTANINGAELFVSIHFNSCDKPDVASGCEVWNYSHGTDTTAKRICNNISSSLSCPSRGLWYSTGLAVLNSTNMPAMLVECLFVNNKKDAGYYNADKLARAIVEGITNQKIGTNQVIYRVQVGAFSDEANADKLMAELKKLGYSAMKVKA